MNLKEKRLLDWLESVEGNMLLESQVIGSGLGKALHELLLQGKVDIVAHPTVRERSAGTGVPPAPASAVILKR